MKFPEEANLERQTIDGQFPGARIRDAHTHMREAEGLVFTSHLVSFVRCLFGLCFSTLYFQLFLIMYINYITYIMYLGYN